MHVAKGETLHKTTNYQGDVSSIIVTTIHRRVVKLSSSVMDKMCNIQQLHGRSTLCCLWAYTVANENESQGQPGPILYLFCINTTQCTT